MLWWFQWANELRVSCPCWAPKDKGKMQWGFLLWAIWKGNLGMVPNCSTSEATANCAVINAKYFADPCGPWVSV